MSKTRFGRAVLRFARTGGYQIVGAAISAAATFVAGYSYATPEGVALGSFIGVLLTSVDKWWRDKPFGE